VRYGKTAAGVQRYQCRVCGQSFTATKSPLFYRKQTQPKEIVETLALLGEESSVLCPFRFERFATGDLHPISNSPFPWS
jgi:hypothetical protein